MRARPVLFTTLAYAKFFALVFVVTWLCARARRLRLLFLLFASYFFYAQSGARFVALIWACSTADFLLSHAIGRAADSASRRRWLTLTVVMNLGVLAVFKYLNFGLENLHAALSALGISLPLCVVSLTLPIGISFFTFESMSYVIDVYRGDIQPQKSYLEYLTFVAFFPHLVAGPIVRPRELLPQLAREPLWDEAQASGALLSIAFGLFKKLAIADYLGLNLVDRVFSAPAQYSALECYLAVVAYAVQIYADFSGYTEIATGSAALLGVRFPVNFAAPYQAYDLVDFWRRWHISLSSWLRDYLYIPLGGNRRGRARSYLNLIATMLLGGLWHGPKWTFLIWGGLRRHGLASNRAWRSRAPIGAPRSMVVRALATLCTFHFVLVAWVFFRADSVRSAHAVFAELATLTHYHPNLDPRVLGVLGLGVALHFLPLRFDALLRARFNALPGLAQGLALFAVLLLVSRLAGAEAVPFVYFQF